MADHPQDCARHADNRKIRFGQSQAESPIRQPRKRKPNERTDEQRRSKIAAVAARPNRDGRSNGFDKNRRAEKNQNRRAVGI